MAKKYDAEYFREWRKNHPEAAERNRKRSLQKSREQRGIPLDRPVRRYKKRKVKVDNGKRQNQNDVQDLQGRNNDVDVFPEPKQQSDIPFDRSEGSGTID